MQKHPKLTEDRIKLALRFVEALIYGDTAPLDIAFWEVHGPPVTYEHAKAQTFVPCKVGQAWGGLWDTAWFHFKGAVPADWKGREVVARVRLGDGNWEGFIVEGLIYQDDKVTRALNVNRRDVAIAKKAKGGEEFEFYIEGAANGGTGLGSPHANEMALPDYEGKNKRYSLHQAELACLNREAFDYYHDFKVALEAVQVLPENSQRRGELLYALNESVNLLDRYDAATVPAAAKALKEVLSRKNGDGGHLVSAVGHAHIDTAWLWPLRETIRKCARTFSTALDYMDEYPDYVFACSQAQQYAWMKEYYPEIFTRIKAAIKRGQWEPVGSMWIEVDCNLASGESIVRQIMHGKKFFKEELGYETLDVWIPDVFGYAASMPQIMRKAGVEYFLTQKISWNQFNKFPHHTFDWEGIDGTRIFTHFPPADTYNADTGPHQVIRSAENFKEHDRATRSLLLFGYGDGGGGPSIEMLEKLKRLKDLAGTPRVTAEKALTFFKKAKAETKDIPHWVGELYLELHRGTYTSQAKNKLGNRKSELLLRDAEFFDALSLVLAPERAQTAADPERAVYDVTGMHDTDPTTHRAALDRAWKLVLLNQFHDIIPGSSINWVYQDSARDYAAVRILGESVRDSGLSAFARKINTEKFQKPLLVANTLGFARKEVARLADGTPLLVEAPACGYAVTESASEVAPQNAVTITAADGGFVLENGLVRLTISKEGYVVGLFDLKAQRETIAGKANAFQLHEDIPNFWDAWDVDIFYKEKTQEVEGLEVLEIGESHPLLASVKIVRNFSKSRIEQRVILRAESARVDFETKVDWQENQKFLKVAFPVDIRSISARYEIQFGHVERPTHMNTSWDMARFEVCAQKWADLSENGYGVALLNDCKYGHDIFGNIMRLSLLTASHMPDPVADRGQHQFTYSILPHAGDFAAGRVKEEAAALNTPLIVRELPTQTGELPASQSFFSVDRPGVVIETIKVAENGKDVVVRLFEADGARGPLTLKTSLPCKSATLVNLLEDEISSLPLTGGTVVTSVKPFEIQTIRFEV
jgi:alpha-mannosidase